MRVHLEGLGLGERRTADPSATLRSPEFLSRLVALADFMRLSLMKAAHADLSDVAKQEFGFATVGMTKGRVTVAPKNCYWDG